VALRHNARGVRDADSKDRGGGAGSLLLTIKRGKRTIAARNAKVRSSCRFSKTATLSARAIGGARTCA
jgi:hypothetical protein